MNDMEYRERYIIDPERYQRIFTKEEYKKLTDGYAKFLYDIYDTCHCLLTDSFYFDSYAQGYMDGVDKHYEELYLIGLADGMKKVLEDLSLDEDNIKEDTKDENTN